VAAEREGRLPVLGGEIWYRLVGSGDLLPLIGLHGGPGGTGQTIEPIVDVADERPVVIYDQLGCGRSGRPTDAGLWRIERFVDELDRLVDAMGYDKVVLFGNSWGCMLALDYTLSHAERVGGLILASPCLSVSRWVSDCERLIRAMGPEFEEIYNNPHASSEDRVRLDKALFERHFCRVQPLPQTLVDSIDGVGWQVFETMWGPNDYTVVGNLRDYERVDSLSKIGVPTLFTCGRYDEATPETTGFFASQVPDSEFVIFEHSAHLAQFEERPVFVETIRSFLNRRLLVA